MQAVVLVQWVQAVVDVQQYKLEEMRYGRQFLSVMKQLNMSILHSVGRIIDVELYAVLKEQELGTFKEG